MHGIKNPDLSQMPKMPLQVDKNALDKRLVSATPDVGTQMEIQDPAGSLEAPSAKRLKTQFRCSKCGFVTDNSTEFQQHIPQHKTDENTPQCLHCGLCFTSVLSLNRHLFIVHKVKDPEEEEKKEEGDVNEKEQDNQPAGSAESDEENDLFYQLNKSDPSQAGEPESPHCSKSTDCNLNPSTHSPTQAVSLQQ